MKIIKNHHSFSKSKPDSAKMRLGGGHALADTSNWEFVSK